MINKILNFLMIILIVVGIIVCIGNITTSKLDAGQITKFGTYDPDNEYCPGIPSNCVIVWYVPDGD
ncbi:MAG: hypothetical protein PVH61_07260 [Candidatus Aminicenantes bacterium]|jgi:hypothetical protein